MSCFFPVLLRWIHWSFLAASQFGPTKKLQMTTPAGVIDEASPFVLDPQWTIIGLFHFFYTGQVLTPILLKGMLHSTS
jgi:hypothetical protein